jgi:uncharacterized membrane protein
LEKLATDHPAIYPGAVHLFANSGVFGGGWRYILALSGWRWSRALTAYLGSVLTSLLLFSPWIVILWQQRVQDMAGGFSFEPLGAAQMLGTLKHWGGIFSRTFIDFNVTVESPRLELVAIAGISGLLMVLIGYSFYVLVKRSPARVWGFIVILCLSDRHAAPELVR